jgi:putative glutathione S-transferase
MPGKQHLPENAPLGWLCLTIAEPGRYHLYVSLACPWAHRTLIFRALKGLQDAISLSVVHWHMGVDGWTFEPGPGVIAGRVHNARLMYQVYAASDRAYTGRVTVPVLWDRSTGKSSAMNHPRSSGC